MKSVIDEQGIEKNSDEEVEEAFNKYFNEIGKIMASKINPPNLKFSVETQNSIQSMFLGPITKNELISQIKTLKNDAAQGEDNITVKLIKNNHPHLLTPLLHLINLIFVTGNFPKCLKHAIITPIHKSGDKKVTSNYRPIALTSNLSKLVEKCIKLRLTQYLAKNNLLSNKQFGFCKDFSTEDAVICLTDYVNRSLSEGNVSMGIFLDLGKAFDTVTHQILLTKLEKLGIRGLPHKLFKSYLSERTQSVKINNSISTPKSVEFGVPQGTVLGPVLFLIYVNELLNLIPEDEGHMVCFADDTAIVIKGKSWEEIVRKEEVAITKVKSWFDENYLTLNADKSTLVCFSVNKAKSSTITEVTIHKHSCQRGNSFDCTFKIKKSKTVKYLGVIIDQSLN